MPEWPLRLLGALVLAGLAGAAAGWLVTRGLPRLLAPRCPRCHGPLLVAETRLLRPGRWRPGAGAPEDGLEEVLRRCARCGHERRETRRIPEGAPRYGLESTLPPPLLADYLETEMLTGERETFLRPIVERLRREGDARGDQDPGRGSQG